MAKDYLIIGAFVNQERIYWDKEGILLLYDGTVHLVRLVTLTLTIIERRVLKTRNSH